VNGTACTTTEFIDSPVGRIPAVRKCPYCGKPLKTTSVTVRGKVYSSLPRFGSCGCERSAMEMGFAERVDHPSKRCPECGTMVKPGTDGICSCPVCSFEFVAKSTVDERNDALRAINDALLAESMGGLMAAAGVPPFFQDADADMRSAVDINESGKGRYIQGGNGTQKTLAAASIARAFLDMGKSVKFVSSSMLMSEFRDSIDGGRSEADIFQELFQADLLILDDLGKENASDWTVSLLFNVVDGRYGYNRPIVVTTNYPKSELVARLTVKGDDSTARAIVSRLFEMTEKVDFGNEDRRIR